MRARTVHPGANWSVGLRPARISYILSHPIQYQSAMLRSLANYEEFDIKVYYSLDTTRGMIDPEFGEHVKWDVDLLEGYSAEFLPCWIGGSRPTFARPVSRGLSRLLHRSSCDLAWIHGWGRVNELAAILAASRNDVPVLLRTENNFCGPSRPRPGIAQGIRETLKHWAISRSDAIGYMGGQGYQYFRAYRAPSESLFDMPYVVDNEWWVNASDSSDARGGRELLGIPESDVVVLYVGKLTPRKGIIDLLRAYASLPQGARVWLLVAGSGEMQEEATEFARLHDLDRVRFLGFKNQAELPLLFTLADLFVVPSRDEQWGVVINEALNCQCAVLASDECGAAVELVLQGETGEVYAADSLDSLKNALASMVSDKERLRQMGRRGRAHIAHFEASLIRDRLCAVLEYLHKQGKIDPACVPLR